MDKIKRHRIKLENEISLALAYLREKENSQKRLHE